MDTNVKTCEVCGIEYDQLIGVDVKEHICEECEEKRELYALNDWCADHYLQEMGLI